VLMVRARVSRKWSELTFRLSAGVRVRESVCKYVCVDGDGEQKILGTDLKTLRGCVFLAMSVAVADAVADAVSVITVAVSVCVCVCVYVHIYWSLMLVIASS